MGNIIEMLQNVGVADDDYIYLNYEDSAEVWHITDDYIEGALNETDTANMLARVLATGGVTVLSRYEEDVLQIMRDQGLLEDYEHDGSFEEYLADKIRVEAYEYDLLTISTQRHDHKRGTCEIAINVKVTAAELFSLDDASDSFVAGFDIIVQTSNGLLTLV